MDRRDVFVSVLLVASNCNDVIEDVLRLLRDELEKKFTNHEIVLIDMCSVDGTVETVTTLLNELPRIRLVELTSTVPDEMAWAAGMENAIGDIVVFFSLKTDPIELLAQGVDLCIKGIDIVVGVSTDCRPKWYPVLGRCFRLLFGQLIGYQVPLFATCFRVLSRRSVNSILSEKHFHHNLFARIARLRLASQLLEYRSICRGNEEAPETFTQACERAISVITFSSTKPLRLMSFLGLIGSSLSACISSYSILVNVLKDKVVEGWTTTVVFLSVQFFLVFLILAFHGEYIARLIEETADHKDYNVLFEKHSSVMVHEDRLNVSYESVRSDISRVQTGRDR
jgi:polyisoprenyl-phosphate glycosyltransferase